jgi:hypothetical protein
MQVYNEKECVGQEEIQSGQFEKKKETREFNVGAMVCAESDKEKQNDGG